MAWCARPPPPKKAVLRWLRGSFEPEYWEWVDSLSQSPIRVDTPPPLVRFIRLIYTTSYNAQWTRQPTGRTGLPGTTIATMMNKINTTTAMASKKTLLFVVYFVKCLFPVEEKQD